MSAGLILRIGATKSAPCFCSSGSFPQRPFVFDIPVYCAWHHGQPKAPRGGSSIITIPALEGHSWTPLQDQCSVYLRR